MLDESIINFRNVARAPGGRGAHSSRPGKRDTPSLRDCYQSPVGHAPLPNRLLAVAACRPRGAGIALFAAAMDRPCGHIPGERRQTGIDLGKHTGIGGEPSAVLPPNSALPLGLGIANVTTADPGAQVENVSARGRRTRYQRVPGSLTTRCWGTAGLLLRLLFGRRGLVGLVSLLSSRGR